MHELFIDVCNAAIIDTLAKTAREIWYEYFPGIISVEQVDYMVEKFQSPLAIRTQIFENGYRYFLVLDDETIIGYFGIKAESDRLFLSKLYLKKDHRGKGHFSGMLTFIETMARDNGLTGMYLTVNKHNENSIAVYRKKGFTVQKEQTADIGNGFVMDDLVMEKLL